jgi:hypothetical protein
VRLGEFLNALSILPIVAVLRLRNASARVANRAVLGGTAVDAPRRSALGHLFALIRVFLCSLALQGRSLSSVTLGRHVQLQIRFPVPTHEADDECQHNRANHGDDDAADKSMVAGVPHA